MHIMFKQGWTKMMHIILGISKRMNRHSSGGIVTGYWLKNWASPPIRSSDSFLCHHVYTGCGDHPASYLMSTRTSSPDIKLDKTWSWPLTSTWCWS